jgi:hypothetical protein
LLLFKSSTLNVFDLLLALNGLLIDVVVVDDEDFCKFSTTFVALDASKGSIIKIY